MPHDWIFIEAWNDPHTPEREGSVCFRVKCFKCQKFVEFWAGIEPSPLAKPETYPPCDQDFKDKNVKPDLTLPNCPNCERYPWAKRRGQLQWEWAEKWLRWMATCPNCGFVGGCQPKETL